MWKIGLVLVLGVFTAALFACGERPSARNTTATEEVVGSAPSGGAAPIPFTEQAVATGLDFEHVNGMFGEHFILEIMGAGTALFDYDNDGDLDLYLVQSGPLAPDSGLPLEDEPAGDRLYRNQLIETGSLAWTDVTSGAVATRTGYGIGIATGDYDNDGFVDLYITALGGNHLLRNIGGTTFQDVTDATATDDRRWSTTAAFVDYDQDGLLDLVVGNYLDVSLTECFSSTSARDYCGPTNFEPQPDRLFRNLGGLGNAASGSAVGFADVTARVGLHEAYGGTLGMVSADFDADDRPDIYVANDGMANQLWLGRDIDGERRFRDEALLAGCALNIDGVAEASMGLAVGDYDNDGDEDVFMTHLDGETNTLFENDGKGIFIDRTLALEVGDSSRKFTGFGTGWLDYDNDGHLDLLVVNGAVKTLPLLLRRGDPFPLHQTNQLLHNLGAGRFRDVTAQAGAAFELSEVSRGAAFGDVDNDGDTDVVVTNNNGPVRLLVNLVGQQRSWLGLRLLDGVRDAYGARVSVASAPPEDYPTLWRRVATDGSYASASDPRVLFGLGSQTRVDRVEVFWPDGRREQWNFSSRSLHRYYTLHKGEGMPIDDTP